jgi:hypothetical protein
MNPKIVNCLLEHGADPNAQFNGYSAWSNALYYVCRSRFDVVNRRDDLATHALQVVEVLKLLLAYGASKKASCMLKRVKISAADAVRLAIPNLDDRSWEEVRTGLQEVLAIIEDKKGTQGRVQKTSTSTKNAGAEDQMASLSFAGSSRSEPHNTFLSHKTSLSQRLKAKLLKRVR